MKKNFKIRIYGIKYSNPATIITLSIEGRDKVNAINRTFKYLKKYNDYEKLMTFDKVEIEEI